MFLKHYSSDKKGAKIVAIEHWGAERTSTVVKQAADVTVGWNTNSIVKAIRGY